MAPEKKPKYRHHCDTCTCLGQVTVNGRSADLYVCADTAIARFSDDPDDYEAHHLAQLTIESSIFLLAAFRLYLDTRGDMPKTTGMIHQAKPLQG